MARGRRRPTPIGPRTHVVEEPEGWSVRVVRGGKKYSEYFGNAVWGGKERALLAAQHYRDELLLRIEPDSRERRRLPDGRRSETGVVRGSIERHRVGGRVYRRYVAHWHDPEEGRKRRRFSSRLRGEEQAKALAVEARVAGVARGRAYLLARQREEAERRLQMAAPMPRPVKDPLGRKGTRMARRRRRSAK